MTNRTPADALRNATPANRRAVRLLAGNPTEWRYLTRPTRRNLQMAGLAESTSPRDGQLTELGRAVVELLANR